MAPTPRGCQRRSFVPLSGFGGALAAPLKAVLQRGRWPRPMCPPTPVARPVGTRELGMQLVHRAAWGPTGGRSCVSRPLPRPHLQAVAPTIQSHCPCRGPMSPGPWLQSPPAAQPVSPAQGAGAATARGGPGPVSLHEAPAACARPVRASLVHLSPHLSLRPSPHLSRLHLFPVHLSKVRPRVGPSVRSYTHLQRRPSTCPARPGPAAPQPGLPRAGGSRGGAARCPGRGRISAAAAATRGSATSAPSTRARRLKKPGVDHCRAERDRAGTRGGALSSLASVSLLLHLFPRG